MAHFNVSLFPLDAPGHWNFRRLLVLSALAFLLQMLFLPCLCDIGRAKAGMALAVDLLVAIRAGVAYLARERGSDWKFYAWLLLTSPVWITIAAYAVLGDAG